LAASGVTSPRRKSGFAGRLNQLKKSKSKNVVGLGLGVDVMITIFCNFRQFSAQKLAFFSKTNVMIKILHSFALF
jgi:hypothetical protein